MAASSKRPEMLSWTSLGLTFIFFCITIILGDWSRYPVVVFLSWQILSGALIWFVLSLQFRLQTLAEREALDMAHLKERESSATIFQVEGQRAELMAVAQRRLGTFEKWFLPLLSLLIAAYEAGIGAYLLTAVDAPPDGLPRNPLIVAVVLTAVAFVSFLMSRYATGMSAEPRWKPLRAGGSVMLASAFLCFALAAGMALAALLTNVVIDVMIWVIPILLIVLAVETLWNLVLDNYRPRIEGQYNRAAFDSRLLGTVNEPGGLFHSLASAIDYQFGFKVSQTWFYRLLERAIVPLVLFGAVTLYLFSCFAVVETGEQAIVERFGNPLRRNGEPRLMEPGLVIKWPWPIDQIKLVRADEVRELYIGYTPNIDEQGRLERRPLLWGQAHYEEEFSVLVASETRDEKQAGQEGQVEEAAPVSLVKANIPVHFKVKDVYRYLYRHQDPDFLLESICYQHLAGFAASATIDVEAEEVSLLGAGRELAKTALMRSIQRTADELELGIDLVFVGVQGIHPPEEVAADYQAVIGAIQTQHTRILNAQEARNEDLSLLAGSVEAAYDLKDLARQYLDARIQNDPRLEEHAGALDAAFSRAQGDIYRTLRQAQAYAFEKSHLAKATGLRFDSQVQAYRAAKTIYLQQLWLQTLVQGLKDVRKYVFVPDPNADQVMILDLQEQLKLDAFEDMLRTTRENSTQ